MSVDDRSRIHSQISHQQTQARADIHGEATSQDPQHVSQTPETEGGQGAAESSQDRYGPHLINKVMRGLRSLMLHRPGDTAQARAANRAHRAQSTQGAQGTAGGQELSVFEKVFLDHFDALGNKKGENQTGTLLGAPLPPGVEKFLAKEAQVWGLFFKNLAPFAQSKTITVSDVQQLILRGVISEGQAFFLIADMQLPKQAGRLQPTWEKCVRILLPEENLSQTLKDLSEKNPGDKLPDDFLTTLTFENDQMTCTALSHRIVDEKAITPENKSMAESYLSPEQVRLLSVKEGTRQATPGIALDARTEALMASRHAPGGIKPATTQLKKKKIGEDETSPETAQTQIPPFLLHPTKSRIPSLRGKPRWYIAFLYGVIAVSAVIGLFYFVRHFV